MQSVSSRIWTRVAVSISYEDNHNTTGTSSVSTVMQTLLIRGGAATRLVSLGQEILRSAVFRSQDKNMAEEDKKNFSVSRLRTE